jgi:cobalt-zinc-cadmium resistance protein CzcA
MAIWGIYAFTQLPVDAVPDITNNQVQVITVATDLAAQEIEQFITFPVEQSLATIPGKTELRSFSRMGLSLVTIVFDEETDIYWARQQVAERLREAESQIPAGMGRPEMTPVTTGLGEIYQYVIKPQKGFESTYSLSDLRTIQDWIIRRQLLGTPGLADVSSFGGHLKQVEIAVQPSALQSMRLEIADVVKAIDANNSSSGGSYIEHNGGNLYVRADGLLKDVQQISDIPITLRSDGTPVRLSEIADVREGFATRFGAMTSDSSGEAVGGVVLMLKGANSSAVIAEVRTRMAEIQKSLPPGLTIKPFLDRTKLVNSALSTVSKNLAEGALIVIFVLVIILGNLRAGLIVASVIPLAMLFAIILMDLFGVSGNLMSLGAIDFGLIVDGAVIIIEAVVHAIAGRKVLDQSSRMTRKELDSIVEVNSGKMMRFAAFGQIIIMIVYLPILTLAGVEGKMFIPMAQTVGFAIIGALILSLTWVPVAASLFLSRKQKVEKSRSDIWIESITQTYRNALSKVIAKQTLVLSSAAGLLIAAIVIFNFMGAEFIPTLEEGDFAIETRLPNGSSLPSTIEAAQRASAILLKQFPEVITVTGKIGTSEIPVDPMPIEACDLIVSLKDRGEWTSASSREELAERMAEALSQLPGVSFGFQQPIQMRFNELMTGARQDVVLKIYGDDLNSLSTLADKAGKIAGTVQGAQDVYIEQVTGLPQLFVEPDRNALLRYGVSVDQVLQLVRSAYSGQESGLIFEGEKRFKIVVKLPKELRNDPETIGLLTILDSHGSAIPLSALANISVKDGPVQIQRDEARRRVIIGFNVRGRDVASVVEDLKLKINSELTLPPGYSVTYGGQFKNLEEATSRLMYAVPVALALIFILLYFTFASAKYSLLIFSAVPFAAIGGILALWIRGMPFSISAGIGFIALSGVAVLNGIVLIGSFLELKSQGLDAHSTVLRGAASRFRPVIMTALVASLGFLPMAISNSSGAEVQKPLATVVIGGLISATLLTLFILPLFYLMAEKIRPKAKAVIGALIILLAIPQASYAQSTEALPLDSLIARMHKNHPRILQATLEERAETAMKGASFDAGNFSLGWMFGQYNSQYRDNQFSIQQGFPNPALVATQSQLSKTKVEAAQMNTEITTRELDLAIQQTWQTLLWAKQRKLILQASDSTLQELAVLAEKRFSAGEGTRLEWLQIKNAAQQASTSKLLSEQFVKNQEMQLGFLCGQTQPLTSISNELFARLSIPVSEVFMVSVMNPSIKLEELQLKIALSNAKLERRKMLPAFQLGYFNQSLKGIQNINGQDIFFGSSDRFSGFQAGLNFPLIFNAASARSKSAKLQADAASKRLQGLQLEVLSRSNQLLLDVYQKQKLLEQMEMGSLPLGAETIALASKSWIAGETGVNDLLLAYASAHKTQLDYLQMLWEFNHQVIQLAFILKP